MGELGLFSLEKNTLEDTLLLSESTRLEDREKTKLDSSQRHTAIGQESAKGTWEIPITSKGFYFLYPPPPTPPF